MTLQQFLCTDFLEAQDRLESIKGQVTDAYRTLIKSANLDGSIPYSLKDNDTEEISERSTSTTATSENPDPLVSILPLPAGIVSPSVSTHAMVLHALKFSTGEIKKSIIASGNRRFMAFADKNSSSIKKISDCLKSKISGVPITSETYGQNDPLTISWLVDLTENDVVTASALLEDVKKDYNVRITEKKYLKYDEQSDITPNNKHTFFALRLCLIDSNLHFIDPKSKKNLCEHFRAELYRHLSWSSIPDSRFDPAEMVFSLEGVLILDPKSVDSNTIKSVVDALQTSQQKNSYWRPVDPILLFKIGAALYPLSIEIVNSLMRICALKDAGLKHDRLFKSIEPMLRRYYDWISAQVVTIKVDNKPYSGWHSENISDKNRIDTWQTSQVLIFLQSYSSLLREQIAVDALNASRLKVENLPRDEKILEKISNDPNNITKSEYWNKITSIYEPFKEDPVFKQIGEIYVSPRQKQDEKNCHYSMLLYGPPGTGKSTIPEELAKCLCQPLITLTISDFLAEGAAQTEQRAKNLFQVLEAQRDVVVLFDEIDHFILDRESKIYREQDSVFQFMPPGMLTKLRDLRKSQNCLFIIATNFKERIDAAAIRLGRIDDHFLVMPPDREARHRILTEDNLALENTEHLDNALINSALYIYNEIKEVKKLSIVGNALDLKRFVENLRVISPSTTLLGYSSRIYKADERDTPTRQMPFKEFFYIIYYKYLNSLDLSSLPGKVYDYTTIFDSERNDAPLIERAVKSYDLGTHAIGEVISIEPIANYLLPLLQKSKSAE